MAKKYWRVCGHKKFETFFDEVIPAGTITNAQLRELLKCLTAKAALSYEEIIGGYVKRKTKLAHNSLDVQRDDFSYFCGNDPAFVAALVAEDKTPIPRPRLP